MSYPAFSLSIHLWRRISSRSAKNSLYNTEFFTSSEPCPFGGSSRFVLNSLSIILSRSQVKTAVLIGLRTNSGRSLHRPSQLVRNGKEDGRNGAFWVFENHRHTSVSRFASGNIAGNFSEPRNAHTRCFPPAAAGTQNVISLAIAKRQH